MRLRRTSILLLTLAVSAALAAAACATSSTASGSAGAGPSQAIPTPAPVAAPADPLASFAGQRVASGEAFVLDEMDRGVTGHGLIVHLEKVEESRYKEPGRPEVLETKAVLRVTLGEESKRVTIDEGASKTRFGCKLDVATAQVEYVDARADYLPRVKLTITCP